MDELEGIGHYQFKGDLGTGAFSTVKLALDHSKKRLVACKVIEKKAISTPSLKAKFESEIRILQQLSHPNIVQLYDLLKDDDRIYIIMEFCSGGELFEHILEREHLTEAEAKPMIKEILSGLKFVHSFGIAHRDLKPENLLFGDDGEIKISDFGFSRFVDQNGLAQTPCGSPCYAAPEVISGRPYDARKSDIWSTGVVAYAMLTGKLPWTQRNQNALFDQIRKGNFVIPNFLSPLCQDFLATLMEVSDKKRPSAEDALNHPWIANAPCYGQDNRQMRRSSHACISLQQVDKFFEDNKNISNSKNSTQTSISDEGENQYRVRAMCRCASDPPPLHSQNTQAHGMSAGMMNSRASNQVQKKYEIVMPEKMKKMSPQKKMQMRKPSAPKNHLPPLPINSQGQQHQIAPPTKPSMPSPRRK
ncbi:Calcium/calmodulin-dependent protein kinase type 1 [Tritrichomonas foetus]|uniref:Calcium/calmodulin-dependent protein kinase type 1 n=1 Tax=Tritrichomonas foetus TaxID=1144522 RepID=A0A1J4JXY1_9EUKA|nr:Calcium/calmodulin-dependent protein kinase type 1 [Tritrichomonas foetus]|eukprot:OHT03851.1 Calcium/calmodulin-dependent protein kinase type 1 [Tritrichomonas foetus]